MRPKGLLEPHWKNWLKGAENNHSISGHIHQKSRTSDVSQPI